MQAFASTSNITQITVTRRARRYALQRQVRDRIESIVHYGPPEPTHKEQSASSMSVKERLKQKKKQRTEEKHSVSEVAVEDNAANERDSDPHQQSGDDENTRSSKRTSAKRKLRDRLLQKRKNHRVVKTWDLMVSACMALSMCQVIVMKFSAQCWPCLLLTGRQIFSVQR